MKNPSSHCDTATKEIWLKKIEVVATKHNHGDVLYILTIKNYENYDQYHALSHCNAATTEIWSKNIEAVATKHNCEDAIIRHVFMHPNLPCCNVKKNQKQTRTIGNEV